MSNKRLEITCTGADALDYKSLKELQGALKTRTPEDVERMIRSIKRFGFSFPFFVWKQGRAKHVLDGHGRLEALRALEADGYEIPEIPVSYVKAANREEAKQKLLRLNSQYGAITIEGLEEFSVDMDIDWDDLQLPSGRISLNNEDQDVYSSKVSTPIYKITGEEPSESELYDRSKADDLIAQINAVDVSEAVRQFLIAAAHRHVTFNYGKIAEYYAHAPKDVQELMEQSALVIIDFDRAIENGYVQMSKGVKKLYAKEHGPE